jgi:hypothetical protein
LIVLRDQKSPNPGLESGWRNLRRREYGKSSVVRTKITENSRLSWRNSCLSIQKGETGQRNGLLELGNEEIPHPINRHSPSRHNIFLVNEFFDSILFNISTAAATTEAAIFHDSL